VGDGQASGDVGGAEAAILLSATVLAEAANDDQTRASDFYATPPTCTSYFVHINSNPTFTAYH